MGTPQKLIATPVDPPPGDLPYYVITATDPRQGEVDLTFRGLPGNLPETNRNTFALWQGSAPTPAGKPLAVQPMASDAQPNRIPYSYDFGLYNYAITYQVSDRLETMCAIAWLNLSPTLTLGGFASHVVIEILSITTESIQIRYTVLSGYTPKACGNWIGLWDGIQTNPGGAAPVHRVDIPTDQTEGIVELKGLALVPGFQYTLLYFMAPEKDDPQRTTAGAANYFSTSVPATPVISPHQ